MIPYTLRFDEIQHRKLKVIAAHHGDSLSAYLQKMFVKEIAEWEREHGTIDLPKSYPTTVFTYSVYMAALLFVFTV